MSTPCIFIIYVDTSYIYITNLYKIDLPTASVESELFLSLICLHRTVNILSIQKHPPTSRYMGRKGSFGQECKYLTPNITIPRGNNSTNISNIVITATKIKI